MRYVIFWTIAITILFYLTSHGALADDYLVRFGPGVQNNALTGSTKMFEVRQESHQVRGIYSAVGLGGYVDNSGNGRKGAALIKGQVGVAPGPDTGIYGKAFVGPCLMSSTDVLLGGHFQFCSDLGLGVRDYATSMGIGYSHISSAGLASPNKGRDYVMFEIGVRF